MDGTVTETKSITFEEKKSYTQVSSAYYLAQTTEKKRFQVLLQDLCRNLPDPEHNKPGPKPHRTKDAIFAMCYKVYCGFSARRFSCDLADAHTEGYLTRTIPGMKVAAFMENPAFTPMLFDLVQQSARRSGLSKQSLPSIPPGSAAAGSRRGTTTSTDASGGNLCGSRSTSPVGSRRT